MQTKSIFEWYKAISLQMGNEGIQSHGATILLPLYKITEGFAGKVISGEENETFDFYMVVLMRMVG